MRLFLSLLSVAFVLSFLYVAAVSAAYVAAPVTDGGTLSGKVSFKGAQPPPEKFEFSKFPQPTFCSQADSDSKPGTGEGHRIRQDVKVKGGGLADVVVYIADIEKGKAFQETEIKIIADTCRFLVQDGPSKAVGVVLNAKKSGVKKPMITITNMDADPGDPKTAEGVLHNPHGYDIAGKVNKTIFNKPVTKKGQSISLNVKKVWFKKDKSFMKVECDQHNFMNVWALPVANPYYAIVNEDGTFSIDQIPPGKYNVLAFHPKLGFQTTQIEISAKGKATAHFEYSAN